MTDLTWNVLLGTTLLGAVAGVLGSFAVLRRRALVGDLLSHAALPGLCLAFIFLGSRQFLGMLAGAFVTGVLGVAMMSLCCRWTRTKEDAALGIVLSTFFGAGVVLSSVIQNRPGGAAKAGLETYIYGHAAGMTRSDVWVIAAVAALALVVVLVLYKEFKVFSFDPGFAQAQGWPVFSLDLAMMGTLALVTMIGLPAVGVVLMAAMLITPGAAARFWTNRLELMLVLSAVLGALAGALGTMVSAGVLEQWLGYDPLAFGPSNQSLPTGPVIVLCGTVVFLLSVFLAPQHGVLARVFDQVRLRRRTARENLLRTMYELSEPDWPARTEITVSQVCAKRAWSTWTARWLLWRAVRRGLAARGAQGVRLTDRGMAEARRLVRAHRLWELFLIEGIRVAPDHVDRDADSIEHLLTPELVARLEAGLADGEKPDRTVPASPHEIPAMKSISDRDKPSADGGAMTPRA